jgi:rhamnopyranosyl-N-acetylglucosaminyl-diphospho-decaprenol beta-1,3/1,4-galactofuranosyltransferase
VKKDRIAAVIVTYNRKEFLLKNLDGLLNQSYLPDAIFIIDNQSDDGTVNVLKEKSFIEHIPNKIPEDNEVQQSEIKVISGGKINIFYTRKKENDGGAGGFYYGMKHALKEGYDWFWIMDDDAIPEKDSLKELVAHLEDNIGGLCSTVLDANGSIDLSHRINLIKKFTKICFTPLAIEEYNRDSKVNVDVASYVGFLINAKAVKKVGLPIQQLFIFYDDTEHSIRLKKYGPIFLIPSSRITHLAPVVNLSNRSKIGDNWKIYYQYRNRLVTIKLHFSNYYFLLLKFEVIAKMVIAFLLGKKAYSNMLKNALKNYNSINE